MILLVLVYYHRINTNLGIANMCFILGTNFEHKEVATCLIHSKCKHILVNKCAVTMIFCISRTVASFATLTNAVGGLEMRMNSG